MFRAVQWNDASEEHIGRHGVMPQEVEDVLFHPPRWVEWRRDSTRAVFGRTGEGRYLAVLVADRGRGEVFVVTARDMTPAERRTYRKKAK
ncbi:BrnT family toxin [Nocardiopsis composta]|uniref:BrnT family toxin n=1 Tax=Nocardiopsis composta TaxID=157465 RepID=A0A7W8QR08_9ACTN|nr:BrnT family toxin [Nocardiopsis composta]MBB5434325.1 hypothetical protein [Nocardiopsis composta]